MKAFALFSLALASCVALAQDVSTKITYSTKAVPLERALKELSEISGVKLDMASAMAAEVVVIKAENVSLKELTDRIAAVTAGEWRKEGEVFKLHPDQAARSREASTENVAKVAALKKAIEERVKALSPKPATTKGQKEEEEELRLGPDEDEKAITLLLSSIDPAVLANLQSGDRLVFSTNPNRMQRSMGQAAPGIINTFVQEHNKSVVDSKMPDNDDLPPGVEIPDFIRDMINRRTKPIGRVGKALLVASKMPMFGTVQLELRLYDPQGNVVHSAPSMLSANEMMEMVRTMAGDAKPQATGKETPVELSEHSKAITQALGGMMSMGGIKTSMKLSPEVKERLFKPDEYDPLSFIPSDSLMSLAKLKKKNLVAVIPDSMISFMGMAFRSTAPTVEGFERELKQGSEATLTEESGWLVVRPARPAEARVERQDRDALAKLLRVTLEKGLPSLDDVAAYSLSAPSPMEGEGVGSMYVMMLVPGAIQQSLDGMTNWDMLRLYGTLNLAQRQNLANGGRITFGNLGPNQQVHLRRMLFGSNSQLEVERPGKKPDAFQIPMMSAFLGGGGVDYRDEPTEVMPQGLPNNGTIELRSSLEPFASPVPDEGSTLIAMFAVLGPSELGLFKHFKEDPAFKEMSGWMPSFDRMRMGERSVHDFTFRVAPQVSQKQTLRDNRLSGDSPVYSMDNLPPAMQDRIAKALADIKKSPLGALGGFMGGMRRPPPP